jgi:SAM-dependent methyltransferase
MIEFDAQAARSAEAMYVTPDIVQQRREVHHRLALEPGATVIDIGSGPGLLALEMAVDVGPTGRVCAIDISPDMIAMSRARPWPRGAAQVEFLQAGVDKIPYPDEMFDAAVSTQVLEYVADIPRALAEIHRVLRPGGIVVLLDTDWDSIVWHSSDPVRMARVLAAWEDHLVDPWLPRTLQGALARAGFTPGTPAVVPLLNIGYTDAMFSARASKLIAGYVPGHRAVTQAEADAWREDLVSMGEDYFFSLNRYLFAATKPA